MVTKNIMSPIVWQLKVFILNFGHLINNGLISTIDLAMEFDLVTKFGVAW
jgi:hypothetical protein